MSLPFDLQKLPPGALEVLRDLGSMTDVEASADTIIRRTGLSERTFRKAIRRLVTRHYVAMTDRDVYSLAPSGREAVDALRTVKGGLPAAEEEDDEVVERPSVPAPSSPIASPMAAAPPATVASAAPPPPRTPSAPAAPAHIDPAPPTEVYHLRRLSIFMPRELVADSPSLLRAGFMHPAQTVLRCGDQDASCCV